MLKRMFDFTVSGIGLIITSPIMLCTAAVISKKLGKPVLFKQIRPGKNGIPFSIYKFRTMTNETDENGQLLSNELRKTKFGSLLRKTSIDELPQLINVIRGDISLVGPRPLLIDYLPLYNDFQRKRMNVKPGITGWAQINGRNAISWEKKFELDVWYVENQSFKLDMYILFKTFTNVLRKKDINANSSISMERFKVTEL
ncbi:sugar transferase [Staphylococcus cohnii]|uniref:sugar transferase n=1 Tax=Staphylococcus cohnii TaxID=29382 RepID=UPI003D7CCDA6